MARYRKNGRVLVRGRPTLIGSPIIKELKTLVSCIIHSRTRTAFVEDLQNLHKKNAFETSRVASCSVKPISRRTICRVLHGLNSKEGQTADAKAVSTEDKLNSLSISAAHSVMAPLSTPHLAVNADTTSSLQDQEGVILLGCYGRSVSAAAAVFIGQ